MPQGTGESTPSPMDLKQQERDRALTRNAIRDWPKRFKRITEAVKDRIVDGLVANLEEAEGVEDTADRCKIRESSARTLIMAERLNQADEHKMIDKVVPDPESKEPRKFVVTFDRCG